MMQSWPPSLPPGYHVQPVRGFRDRTSQVTWEFYRVYQPPVGSRKHPALAHLDESRSYWSVTWPTRSDDGAGRLAGRSMCYAEHCESNEPLTFEAFLSLSPEELSVLLPPDDPWSG